MRERQKEKNAEAVVLVFLKNNICLKKTYQISETYKKQRTVLAPFFFFGREVF
jgi:hypothetical protein